MLSNAVLHKIRHHLLRTKPYNEFAQLDEIRKYMAKLFVISGYSP
jgi:hypothetical protein